MMQRDEAIAILHRMVDSLADFDDKLWGVGVYPMIRIGYANAEGHEFTLVVGFDVPDDS